MLKLYISEFVLICGFITKKLPEQICETYYYIEPARLRKMLDKNKYSEADTKLRVWRNLGWLLCEPERFTKNIMVNGKQKRLAVLNRVAFRQLNELLQPESREGETRRATADSSASMGDASASNQA